VDVSDSAAVDDHQVPAPAAEIVLEVTEVTQTFKLAVSRGRKATVSAVAGVSFRLGRGETLAIVGETGSGKTTLARCVLQAPPPHGGAVRFRGANLVPLRGKARQRAMRGMQVVFQNPFSSLDPRKRVSDLVAEPLVARKVGTRQERAERVAALLASVGLDAGVHGRRRPAELSGGQCQRVAIARAIADTPDVVICDEPVASLDVSVQAQILNLLEELRTAQNLSYLFITHDLSVARHISHRILVLYMGRVCEIGDSEAIYTRPRHPYSALLLASSLSATGERPSVKVSGEPPSALDPPSGCRYRTRCPRAADVCATTVPELRPVDAGGRRLVACHFPLPDEAPAAAAGALGADQLAAGDPRPLDPAPRAG
jgi:oligopeptide transport system ATP-binding protein